MQRQELPTLPPGQKKVADLLAEGNTVGEVAIKMGKSVNTISTQLKHIRRKFNARSAIHVAVLWLRAHG
jgi:DNA-binding CsgD family transcriptional regulator